MSRLIDFLRRYKRRRHVRPWALLVPLLVLLFCLPLLKPLRQPDPRKMGDEEGAIFGTVQALVERGTFAIDDTPFVGTRQKATIGDHQYALVPPVYPLLLSVVYRGLNRYGLSFEHYPILVMYLLTLAGATLPVATASGLTYRMARLFELSRPWRAILTFALTFATGWVSFATVLNPYAAATALIMCALACLIHVAMIGGAIRASVWLILTGFCASLAYVIDFGAGIFLVLLALVIPSFRWHWAMRILGLLAYCIGATIPLAVHANYAAPIFGEWRMMMIAMPNSAPPPLVIEPDEESLPQESRVAFQQLRGWVYALFSTHGVLFRFPILLLGFFGVAMVMHRHWPSYAKVLAASAVVGMIALIALYLALNADYHGQQFAARAFLVASPPLLFWAGAWLRRPHRPQSWTIAGIFFAYSLITSIYGAIKTS